MIRTRIKSLGFQTRRALCNEPISENCYADGGHDVQVVQEHLRLWAVHSDQRDEHIVMVLR